MILRNMIAYSQELSRRGIVSNELSQKIFIVARDFQRLYHNLSRVTAEGFRDSGLRAGYLPNVPNPRRMSGNLGPGPSHLQQVSQAPQAANGFDYPRQTLSMYNAQAAQGMPVAPHQYYDQLQQAAVPHPQVQQAYLQEQRRQLSPPTFPHHERVGSNRGAVANLVASNATGPAPAAAGNAGGTRVPKRTTRCGISKPVPVKRFRRPHQDTSDSYLKCINCDGAFRDHRALYTHFPVCVDQRGNVNGACWFDHASVEVDDIPESLMQ